MKHATSLPKFRVSVLKTGEVTFWCHQESEFELAESFMKLFRRTLRRLRLERKAKNLFFSRGNKFRVSRVAGIRQAEVVSLLRCALDGRAEIELEAFHYGRTVLPANVM